MSRNNGSFVTPENEAVAEIVMKKSRFIGNMVPVKSVDEAEEALDLIRLEHKTATHNCYAYTVGLGVPVERFSDDGEPSGTAGRPILEVLRRREVSNALVVVTRYFGGTLLGASGLIHAYTDATVAAVDESSLLSCELLSKIQVECDYGQFGKLEYELTQLGYRILDREFAEVVRLAIWSRLPDVESMVTKMGDWSSGQAVVNVLQPEYVGVRADGEFAYGVWPNGNSPFNSEG